MPSRTGFDPSGCNPVTAYQIIEPDHNFVTVAIPVINKMLPLPTATGAAVPTFLSCNQIPQSTSANQSGQP